MMNKIAQRFCQEAVSVSSGSTNASSDKKVEVTEVNHTAEKILNQNLGIPPQEKSIYMNKSRSTSLINGKDFWATKIHQSEQNSSTEKSLIDNLLKYLNVGSNDSLNIMKDIFKFHRYNTTLLDRYISNRTPENFRALTIQIQHRLFVVNNQKPADRS